MRHIYSSEFKYRKAVETDVRKTFERVRAEQQQAIAATGKVVSQIKPKVRAKL